MGLTTKIKVLALKTYLKKLRSVDHGTTVAGTIASVLLAAGLIDLDKLLGGEPAQAVIEVAKALAILTFWGVMRLIGRPVDMDQVIKDATRDEETRLG